MSDQGNIHSHGVGGAGNIARDTTQYVDGEITHQAVAGQSETGGAFSTGIGGAGNIGSSGLKAQHPRNDDVVPEQAIRKSLDGETHHYGRGGDGNVVRGSTPDSTTKKEEGVADKIKHKILGKKEES